MVEQKMSWDLVLDALTQWHATQDPAHGNALFRFLEEELRAMLPNIVRRKWSESAIDDALQKVLIQLSQKPLPDSVSDPRNYIARILRNRCISIQRAEKRKQEVSLDADEVLEPETDSETDAPYSSSPARVALQKERVNHYLAVLAQLNIADRVALKLESAPNWLNNEEMDWLSNQSGLALPALREAISAASDTHALTRIYDPGDDDPGDLQLRRKRMERFRKRRSRAREALYAMMKEVTR